MAAPKRVHAVEESGKENSDSTKKGRLDDDISCGTFLTWCKEQNLMINVKVRIGKTGSVHQYGMMAVEDIEEGECLFEVPRHLLLGPQNCCITALLEKEAECLESASGWLPLLVGLMYEYTNPASKWRPYYSLVPDFTHLDLPMFWPRSEMETLLRGTSVPEAVIRDLSSLEKEFVDKVKPFVKKHPEVFTDARCQDLEFFKKMVAFVMAYSFTEPPPDEEDSDMEDEPKVSPVMVPMADILNHIAKNNAKLEFHEECLKMVATKPVKKGNEIFNTYGELPNWQLLQMYGFAEKYPENHFDTVDIPMVSVLEVMSHDQDDQQQALLKKKWQFLKSLDLVQDDGMYVVGMEGVLTEDEMYNTLKVMTMDESKFAEHLEKEGWSDADEEEIEQGNMGYGDIEALPESWRDLLKRVVEYRMSQFGTKQEEDGHLLEEIAEKGNNLKDRERYAAFIRDGQRRLLQQLLEACSGQ